MLLVLGWVALSAVVNSRYPAFEPRLWYLIPSLDVTVLFGLFAVLGLLGWRIPRLVFVLFAVLFAFVRLFRVADGITLSMQHRGTNVFIDGQLLPSLVKLASDTVPATKLLLITFAGAVVLLLVGWASYKVLRMAARLLCERRRAFSFGLVVMVFALVGSLTSTGRTATGAWAEVAAWRHGAFADSVVPRFGDDFTAYWEARAFPEQVRRQVAAQSKLDLGANLLSELHGANVLLIFIESYGETVLSLQQYKEPIKLAHEKWEATLVPQGFHIASTVMESPTVGGYSWLAHVTVATGLKVTDQSRFKRVHEIHPKTLVHYFVEAGYDTLLVQPATMTDPGPLLYPFKNHRYSWEFGYRGRNFSWAPMPDQFVLDFIRRHEIAKTNAPLFIEYNLVSGHMPWNDQPPYVEDWDSLGNGSQFRHSEGVRFETDWSNLRHAHPAYLRSMLYDLEVLRQYITRYVRDDTLMIILGDHQPVGDVTNKTASRGVPVHIISRNPRFVDKFIARGYTKGMRPKNVQPYRGMETFMSDFLQDFSRH